MIEEILNNVTKTKNSSDPFEHKFIKNIFPENFYKTLITNLPHIDDYTPINQTGSVDKNYSPERFIFDLNLENINKLDKPKQEALIRLVQVFTSPIFFKVVSNEFKKTIQDRINNFSDHEIELLGKDNHKFNIQALLIKDFKKYQLGAHTDTPKKLLTFLFYIPKNDDLINLGTALYSPIAGIKEAEELGSYHMTKELTDKNFKLVKKMPFIPNSLLIFPRTNNSFHGVEEINQEQSERNLIALNYNFQTIS